MMTMMFAAVDENDNDENISMPIARTMMMIITTATTSISMMLMTYNHYNHGDSLQ
jgi:hypothetical protein